MTNQGRMIRNRIVVNLTTIEQTDQFPGQKHEVTSCFPPASGLGQDSREVGPDVLTVLET